MLRRPNNKESPPVFSHEFVIQNHADIISCVCMVIFMGLIPQVQNYIDHGLHVMQMWACITAHGALVCVHVHVECEYGAHAYAELTSTSSSWPASVNFPPKALLLPMP